MTPPTPEKEAGAGLTTQYSQMKLPHYIHHSSLDVLASSNADHIPSARSVDKKSTKAANNQSLASNKVIPPRRRSHVPTHKSNILCVMAVDLSDHIEELSEVENSFVDAASNSSPVKEIAKDAESVPLSTSF